MRISNAVFFLFVLGCTSGLTCGGRLPVGYGLELHLAADEISGISDGDTVSNWADLSIHDRDAVQGESDKRPIFKTNVINGNPVVRYDGVDDYLGFLEVENVRMVFWVIKEDAEATENNRCILGHSSQSAFHRGWPKELWSTTYSADEVLNGTTKINGTVVDGASINAPVEFSIVSLITTGGVKANQLTKDRYFADRVWEGDIAEVIIYSRPLTTAEEEQVGAYLQEKYGIEGEYPASEVDEYVLCKPGGGGDLSYSDTNPLVVTMDLQNVRQRIESFGASDCWSIQYVGNWPVSKTNAMADLLFSVELDGENDPKGIGLSLWRFNIGAGSSRDTNPATMITDAWRRADTFLDASFTGYDWSRCSGQRLFLQAAKVRGVKDFLAFAISPPVNMTKNGLAYCDSTVGTTNLESDKFDDYAEYLSTIIEHFRNVEGIDFDYISPLNEPQWNWESNSQEGCRYSSADIKQVVDELSASLSSNGLDTQILICESGEVPDLYEMRWYDLNYIQDFFDPTSANCFGSNDNVRGIISGHSYFSCWPGMLTNTRTGLANTLNAYGGLGYAMTEYCILLPNVDWIPEEYRGYGNGRELGIDPALWITRVMHYDLAVAEAGSWQWWLGVSPHDYKDGLVYCDKNETDGNFYESKMLWGMGNFSRFVRPGMYRIELDRSDGKGPGEIEEDMMVSGYYSYRHGRAVFVFVNCAYNAKSVRLEFDNLMAERTIDYLVPYVTAGNDISNDNLTAYDSLSVNEVFKIPARSIVTVVGSGAVKGDIEPDGDVEIDDLLDILMNWLEQVCTDCGRTDVNNDGKVNLVDFVMLAQNWKIGVN